MAAFVDLTAGRYVDALALLEPGGAMTWAEEREPGDVPMPLVEQPVEQVLEELADAMRYTDMVWPRPVHDQYVARRSLAWSRCRAYLPNLADWQPVPETDRKQLIDDFVAGGAPDNDVTRSLADLFVTYGEGYITAGPLCWSPAQVELFLADWLPRKTFLDAADREALPETLRRWIRFALQRRDIDPRWIEPVDDPSAWGPAKQMAAELEARGVDTSDSAAVDKVIGELNAERLARRLHEG